MYAIERLDPTDWQNVSTLAQFYDDLATNPYCTNAKGFSYIRSKSHAIKHAYIQPNHPEIIKWLIFDIDDPQALFTYHDNNLPRPQIIIKNPENGHAHYAYRLTTPVGKWRKSSQKAMRYLANVQKALRLALGADKSYGGNLVKNPCHSSHDVYLTGAKPSYTLAELAENLDLELYQKQEPANDEGYGRNYAVFEHVRPQGYAIASASYSEIVRQLQPIAEQYNQRFDVPLFPNELVHIVRSIARYCVRMDFTSSHQKFSRRQAKRGAKGGKVSDSSKGGKARSAKYENKRKQAKEMHQQGYNISYISKALTIHRNTVSTWLKEVISMNETPQDEHIDELPENPDAIMFSELFASDDEYKMNWIDFHVFKGTLEAWIEDEKKIDPDIARYMGMVLLGVAKKIENIRDIDNDNHL